MAVLPYSMIRKSGNRFSEKIMLKTKSLLFYVSTTSRIAV